jgi:ankyrin repeat protein
LQEWSDAHRKKPWLYLALFCSLFFYYVKFEYLLKNGADLNITDNLGMNAFLHAAKLGEYSIFEMLIKSYRADVNQTDEQNRSAIHLACISGDSHQIALEKLVNNKAKINAFDSKHQTALFYAVRFKQALSINRLIYRFKIDYKAKNSDGYTAFHIAAGGGDVAVCRAFFLDESPDVATEILTREDKSKRTPLFSAIKFKKLDAINLLVKEMKADVNVHDSKGHTPLHAAIDARSAPVWIFFQLNYLLIWCYKMVELLLQHGADRLAVDKQQQTPLIYAVDKSDVVIAKLLLEYSPAGNTLSADDVGLDWQVLIINIIIFIDLSL